MKKYSFKIFITFLIGTILGLGSARYISVDLLPDYRPPSLIVSFALPDSPPEVVEQEATAVFENLFSQVPGLNEINSYSYQNRGEIRLLFDRGEDIQFKKFEVASMIRRTYPSMNEQLSYPVIRQASASSPSTSPILSYRINAPFTPYQIMEVAKDLLKVPVSQVGGVRSVSITGARGLQVSLVYDQALMEVYGISRGGLIRQINEAFTTTYPGLITEQSSQQLLLKIQTTSDDLEDLRSLKISGANQIQIPLKQLAEIYVTEQKPRSYLRINGLNSVSLNIYAQEDINRLDLAETLQTTIKELQSKLPAGYELLLNFDDTEYIGEELSKNYLRSFLSLGILLLFTILIYRSFKYLLILLSGLVVNLAICLLAVWVLGIQIHLYTIAGLTISVGLIIDNAIVMLDHYHRKHNLKVFIALLAASLTTAVALLSVFLLPFELRKDLTEFAAIVSLNLMASLLVALFYTPAIYHLLKIDRPSVAIGSYHKRKVAAFKMYRGMIFWLSRYKKIMGFALIFAFGLPVFMLPSKWEGQEWYNKTIGSDFYQEEARPIVDKWLGGGLRLFVRNVFEKYNYRSPEKTRLYVNGRLPYGTTLDQGNEVFKRLEHYLSQVDGIDQYITNIYSPQNGRIEINFTEAGEDSGLPYLLKNRLTARSVDLGGVVWNIYGVGRGYSNQTGGNIANFSVEMQGYNYEELDAQLNRLSDSLLVHPRVKKVDRDARQGFSTGDRPQEYVLKMDKRALSRSGSNPAAAFAAIRERTGNENTSLNLRLDNVLYPVVVNSKGSQEFTNYDVLNHTYEMTDQKFKLTGVADFTLEKSGNTIVKKNRQYIRNLTFDYLGSYKFGKKYLDQRLLEANQLMPLGYKAKSVDFYFGNSKSNQRRYGLILVVILGIYFVCAILFESLKWPFFVLLAIPFSFIGLFLTFGWFDLYFDQGGYAAFLMLVGLSVNAMIFIVHQFKFQSRGNLLKAVYTKASPIILTILSTCLGLIPFLIEGQNEVFWFSFAVGTIGGLIFSLIGIFIFIPAWLINTSNSNL